MNKEKKQEEIKQIIREMKKKQKKQEMKNNIKEKMKKQKKTIGNEKIIR